MKTLVLVSALILTACGAKVDEAMQKMAQGYLEATPAPSKISVKQDRSFFDSYSLVVAEFDEEYRQAKGLGLLASRKETRLAKIRAGLKQGIAKFDKIELNELEKDQEKRLTLKDIGQIVGLSNRAEKTGIDKMLIVDPSKDPKESKKAEEQAVLAAAAAATAPSNESALVVPVAPVEPTAVPVASVEPTVVPVEPTAVPAPMAPVAPFEPTSPIVEPTAAPVVLVELPLPTPAPLPTSLSDVLVDDFVVSVEGNSVKVTRKLNNECSSFSLTYGGLFSSYQVADCPEFPAVSNQFFDKTVESAPASTGWSFQISDRNGTIGWAARLPLVARFYKTTNDEGQARDAMIFVQPDGTLRMAYFSASM